MVQSKVVRRRGRTDGGRRVEVRQSRRAAKPPHFLPLYTDFDIAEMLIRIFMGDKDAAETRASARNLWNVHRLGVANNAKFPSRREWWDVRGP